MYIATHAGILTSDRSTGLHSPASTLQNAPLPITSLRGEFAASVVSLSPGIFSAQDHLTSELLRTL